jgi:hypothetical protein
MVNYLHDLRAIHTNREDHANQRAVAVSNGAAPAARA